MKQTWSIVSRTSLAIDAFALAAVFSPVAAQQASVAGSLAGTVTEESGRPIPDATVRISRADGASPREVTTSSGTRPQVFQSPGSMRASRMI